MRVTRAAVRSVLLPLALLSACSENEPSQTDPAERNPAATANPSWVIPHRTLPPPAAASDELRAAIEQTPQPNVEASRQSPYSTAEEWTDAAAASSASRSESVLELARAWSVAISEDHVAGVTVRHVTSGETDPANDGRLFVHVHGGAYVFNGGLASVAEAILIARRAKIPVLSIDYRMPPAHPFPAAVDDVVAVWKHLLADRPARAMALGGTSAGGGLTLAAVHRFKELGLEVPGAIWAGTPWADLTKTGDSHFTNEGIDRLLVTYDGVLESAARLYADGHDLKSALISPVYGDFAGFPPTQLVTGTRDLFLSDVVRVHRKMRMAGVIADLNVYEGVSHGDYALIIRAPESEQVYAELGTFLLTHLE